MKRKLWKVAAVSTAVLVAAACEAPVYDGGGVGDSRCVGGNYGNYIEARCNTSERYRVSFVVKTQYDAVGRVYGNCTSNWNRSSKWWPEDSRPGSGLVHFGC